MKFADQTSSVRAGQAEQAPAAKSDGVVLHDRWFFVVHLSAASRGPAGLPYGVQRLHEHGRATEIQRFAGLGCDVELGGTAVPVAVLRSAMELPEGRGCYVDETGLEVTPLGHRVAPEVARATGGRGGARMEPSSVSGTELGQSEGAISERPPRRHFQPITLVLCGVCTLLFLAIASRGEQQSWESLASFGYLPAERVWDGAYWALVSSAFIHLALWHLAFNVYWLWVLGTAVERVLGTLPFVGLVLVSAFVSSSAQLGVSGSTGHGVSGVVYALFGLMWAARRRVPAFAQVLGARTAPLFWTWLVGCILATQAGIVQVGNGAHAAGLVLGLLAAYWLIPGTPRRTLAMLGVGLFVVLSFLSLFWSPWSSSWVGYKAYKAHIAGEYDAAISGYRRSIALGGDRRWALANLAFAYHAKGQEKECVATLAELRAVDPAAAVKLEWHFRRQPGTAAEKAR